MKWCTIIMLINDYCTSLHETMNLLDHDSFVLKVLYTRNRHVLEFIGFLAYDVILPKRRPQK